MASGAVGSPNGVRLVNVYKNGRENTGRLAAVPSTWDSFLNLVTYKLKLTQRASTLYDNDGNEITSLEFLSNRADVWVDVPRQGADSMAEDASSHPPAPVNDAAVRVTSTSSSRRNRESAFSRRLRESKTQDAADATLFAEAQRAAEHPSAPAAKATIADSRISTSPYRASPQAAATASIPSPQSSVPSQRNTPVVDNANNTSVERNTRSPAARAVSPHVSEPRSASPQQSSFDRSPPYSSLIPPQPLSTQSPSASRSPAQQPAVAAARVSNERTHQASPAYKAAASLFRVQPLVPSPDAPAQPAAATTSVRETTPPPPPSSTPAPQPSTLSPKRGRQTPTSARPAISGGRWSSSRKAPSAKRAVIYPNGAVIDGTGKLIFVPETLGQLLDVCTEVLDFSTRAEALYKSNGSRVRGIDDIKNNMVIVVSRGEGFEVGSRINSSGSKRKNKSSRRGSVDSATAAVSSSTKDGESKTVQLYHNGKAVDGNGPEIPVPRVFGRFLNLVAQALNFPDPQRLRLFTTYGTPVVNLPTLASANGVVMVSGGEPFKPTKVYNKFSPKPRASVKRGLPPRPVMVYKNGDVVDGSGVVIEAKNSIEDLANTAAEALGLETSIVRLFTTYGIPLLDISDIKERMIIMVSGGEPFTPVGIHTDTRERPIPSSPSGDALKVAASMLTAAIPGRVSAPNPDDTLEPRSLSFQESSEQNTSANGSTTSPLPVSRRRSQGADSGVVIREQDPVDQVGLHIARQFTSDIGSPATRRDITSALIEATRSAWTALDIPSINKAADGGSGSAPVTAPVVPVVDPSDVARHTAEEWGTAVLSQIHNAGIHPSSGQRNLRMLDLLKEWSHREVERFRIMPGSTSSIRMQLALTGPRYSGKTTGLSLISEVLVKELVRSEQWQSTLVFPLDWRHFLKGSCNPKSSNVDPELFYTRYIKHSLTIIAGQFPSLTLFKVTRVLELLFAQAIARSEFPKQTYLQAKELLTACGASHLRPLRLLVEMIQQVWHSGQWMGEFLHNVLQVPIVLAETLGLGHTLFVFDHVDTTSHNIAGLAGLGPQGSAGLHSVVRTMVAGHDKILSCMNAEKFDRILGPDKANNVNVLRYIHHSSTIDVIGYDDFLEEYPEVDVDLAIVDPSDPSGNTVRAVTFSAYGGCAAFLSKLIDIWEMEQGYQEDIAPGSDEYNASLSRRRALSVHGFKLLQPLLVSSKYYAIRHGDVSAAEREAKQSIQELHFTKDNHLLVTVQTQHPSASRSRRAAPTPYKATPWKPRRHHLSMDDDLESSSSPPPTNRDGTPLSPIGFADVFKDVLPSTKK